jgi:hypothetical protein
MKNVTFLFAALIFIATFFVGCKKTIDEREVFLAFYNVNETWTENGKTLIKPSFLMPVYKSSLNNSILLLDNFADYGVGVVVEATVSSNKLTISSQSLPNLRTIVGSGSLENSTLSFTYTETYKGVSNVITTVANKK